MTLPSHGQSKIVSPGSQGCTIHRFVDVAGVPIQLLEHAVELRLLLGSIPLHREFADTSGALICSRSGIFFRHVINNTLGDGLLKIVEKGPRIDRPIRTCITISPLFAFKKSIAAFGVVMMKQLSSKNPKSTEPIP